MSKPLVIEKVYDAHVSKVWEALTDNEQMKQWYFVLPEFRAEVGFEFQFYGEDNDCNKYLHNCKVTEVIEGKKLAYSWCYDGYPGNSIVCFELLAEGKQTRLKLTHSGLETFPQDKAAFVKTNFEEGWNYFTDNALRKFLEK